jgi:hypothetical protein
MAAAWAEWVEWAAWAEWTSRVHSSISSLRRSKKRGPDFASELAQDLGPLSFLRLKSSQSFY